MKKIYYIICLCFSIIFVSCESYNERNFPGYDEAAQPTNIANYTYTLVTADYTTISKAALTIAETASDSSIATSIATNKYFTDSIPASEYVSLLLNTKYLYADSASTAIIKYNKYSPYDTTTIASSNKYTLITSDYDAMGTTSGLPGQYDNFSSSISPSYYIAIWLNINYPYAKANDVKLIRYKYYATTTTQKTMVFVHDGTSWSQYESTTEESVKFIFDGSSWSYYDADILTISFTDGLNPFIAYSIEGNQVWASTTSYGAKMSGYSSGNISNEDWLVSPTLNLSKRATPWISFDHTGKYFGTMTNEATLWISTDYVDGSEPTTGTWAQLTIPVYMTGSDWTFVNSTPIDISAYAGKSNVHIAFKYISSTTAAATWEIKNLHIYEE
jgi:hypothetical protein